MRRLLLTSALVGAISLVCFPALAQVFQDDGTGDSSIAVTNNRRNRYTVNGEVLDATNGTPLAKIQVNIRSDGGTTFFAVMTDDHGRFSFDDLPRGPYTLSTNSMGYQPADEQVEIESGPVLGVELKLLKLGGTDKASQDSSTIISAHELTAPAKARDDMEKGKHLLFDKLDYQGSIRQFQRAIKEFTGYYEAYALMGVAYMDLKNSAEAETALRKSIELSDQKYTRAYVYLATLYSDNRRFADAEPMARKALELEPNSWQADAELSRALVGLNQLSEAEKIAQAAITLQPDEPELYVTLINIHVKLPNYPALLVDTDMYLRIAPDGRAAPQIRAIREQVRQALSKPPADQPQAQKTSDDTKP